MWHKQPSHHNIFHLLSDCLISFCMLHILRETHKKNCKKDQLTHYDALSGDCFKYEFEDGSGHVFLQSFCGKYDTFIMHILFTASSIFRIEVNFHLD